MLNRNYLRCASQRVQNARLGTEQCSVCVNIAAQLLFIYCFVSKHISCIGANINKSTIGLFGCERQVACFHHSVHL